MARKKAAKKAKVKDDINKIAEYCINGGLKPKTINQNKYYKSMAKNTLTFALGVAGSGKTALAVDFAVKAVMAGEHDGIIITRPVVEAGEKLGFLPGTLEKKVEPYMRPIKDALLDILGPRIAYDWIFQHVEVAPLAYMRGRTLKNKVIILDEAQSCSREQLIMFLTRIGDNSKVIITADPDQIDLKYKENSGLSEVVNTLKGKEEVGVVYLTDADVQRSKIVKIVLDAIHENFKALA